MNKGKLVLILLTGCMLLSAQATFAQLLQDRNKLKTAKKKYFKPIISFHKNVKAKANKKTHVSRVNKTPRFSRASTPKKYNINPKYSRASSPKYARVNPRFSKPHAPIKIKAPKRNKPGFLASIQFQKPLITILGGASDRSVQNDYAKYIGKQKKQKKEKGMHPSANHLKVKNTKSEWVRNSRRKFNVIWVRINGNKTQPKTDKQKPKKIKFDKDEKDIWNN